MNATSWITRIQGRPRFLLRKQSRLDRYIRLGRSLALGSPAVGEKQEGRDDIAMRAVPRAGEAVQRLSFRLSWQWAITDSGVGNVFF